MSKVLIVEDDAAMARGLRDNFKAEGYEVAFACDGEAGFDLAIKMQPDLVVLDLMLPKINGYELCTMLRREGLAMPIIMLTAKTQESDVVMGLKLGADDYVKKPFGVRELLARAEALLRRTGECAETEFRFGACVLDVMAHRFYREGKEIELSPKEFELLHYLAGRAGRVLSRDQIMRDVWGYDRLVTVRSIDRFVTALRKKIEADPHHPVHIQTVREVGYRFEMGDRELP